MYICTYPIQRECLLIKHVGDIASQNKSNADYNAGVTAGERNSQGGNFVSWLCPPGHTKDFCRGWEASSCSNEGCNGDFTCDRWNDTRVVLITVKTITAIATII